MSVDKSFVIEKKKKYVHAIAFKVDDEGLFKLDDASELLKVKGKRRSDKMRNFITKVHSLIKEHMELMEENKQQTKLLKKHERTLDRLNRRVETLSQVENENVKLKRDLEKLTKEKETTTKALSKLVEKPIAKPQDTKTQATTPLQKSKPQDMQARAQQMKEIENLLKQEQPKKPLKEETEPQVIWCPYKEAWINPAKCDQCKTLRFSAFQDCRERRTRNPNDPIFKPSKLKPYGARAWMNDPGLDKFIVQACGTLHIPLRTPNLRKLRLCLDSRNYSCLSSVSLL